MFNNIRKKTKIIVSIMFLLVVSLTNSKSIYCTTLSDAQKAYENIISQQKSTLATLSGVEKEIGQYKYDITLLDQKITESTIQLNEVQDKVDVVNTKLEEQEKSLQDSAQSYNVAEDMYTTRLRAIYENGIPSILDMLLSSKGITDFFSKMNVYTSVLEYDKSLVSNIKTQKEYVDYIKKDIEVQKLQLDQLKYDKEKTTEALNTASESKNIKMNELTNSKNNLQEKSKILEKQKDEANRKIEEELQKAYQEALANKNNIVFTGGQFAWPVNNYYIITTRYNVSYDPFSSGKSYIHYGCDVAGSGISGKPIVAVESGIVKVPSFMASGYGNYVIITHGKSSIDGSIYTSLYGHMSSVAVSNGQFVKKGQTIGYIGSTGWSSGAHLHLEMTKDGKRFDPLSAYPAIKFTYT